ncbi:hypothetical protein [Bacillus cereus]
MKNEMIKPASEITETGMYELRDKTKIKFKHSTSKKTACIRELHDLGHLYCSMCGTPVDFKTKEIKF